MHSGDSVYLSMPAGELCDSNMRPDLIEIERRQFASVLDAGSPPLPRLGRFYPKGVLKDVTGVFRANQTPFRVVGCDNGRLTIDMGHPQSGKPIDLWATIGSIGAKPCKRGGSLHHWSDIITDGVGMQARWQELLAHFFDDRPFTRGDESPDRNFYARPRIIQHLDRTA